ncbi:NUDIX domain-containing protein [Nocardia heshunensis]
MAEVEACVQTLLVRDGQVLLMRRRNTRVGNGCWAAPGGCIEAGEDFVTAANRETREEVGVEPQLTDADLAGVVSLDSSHDGGARDVYTYLASSWTGHPQIKEPGLCSALEWFPVQALPVMTWIAL